MISQFTLSTSVLLGLSTSRYIVTPAYSTPVTVVSVNEEKNSRRGPGAEQEKKNNKVETLPSLFPLAMARGRGFPEMENIAIRSIID